jgi:hypothetical protein
MSENLGRPNVGHSQKEYGVYALLKTSPMLRISSLHLCVRFL